MSKQQSTLPHPQNRGGLPITSFISLCPEGKQFPIGVGWGGGGGGLLLLLFLNNFCYSCNENLKGKEEGKKKKYQSHLLPRSGRQRLPATPTCCWGNMGGGLQLPQGTGL